MADRFEDARGVIQDLLGPVDGVTLISTVSGAVRGNHVHDRTIQWTYIVSGALLVATPAGRAEYPAGQMITEGMGIPHAWQALEDTVVLVFTRGPRSGEAYETDTRRLAEPLIVPAVAP
jgi:quercetin dioxygenase-like cupin family protein